MLAIGVSLQNRYHIVGHIGGGGMAEVYLAEDMRLAGRRCAIKEMSPAALPAADRNWAITTFRQEAQILASLRHRGLAPVADCFAESGNWYLVMEFVEGMTLEDRLQQSPGKRLAVQDALSIVYQLCEVLNYLHHQSPPIIFRDLKPGNIMLTPQGEVKLIDFGIARFFKPGKAQDTVNLGTPGYAAPEQHGRGGQTDARSDIYSLGVLLHQLLTGHDPTTTIFSLPPAHALNPNIPPAGEAVIVRATQMDPALRFQSVQEFRQALFLATPTPTTQMPVMPPISPTVATGPYNLPYPPTTSIRPTRSPDLRKAALLAGLLFVVALAGVMLVWTGNQSSTAVPGTATATSGSAPPEQPTITPLTSNTSAVAAVSSPVTESAGQVLPPATDTQQPEPTLRPTSTPRPVPTAIPTHTQPPPPPCGGVTGPFAGIWSEFQDRLGCPVESAHTTDGAAEVFERGRMYWRKDNSMIYAVIKGGRWESHRDTWQEGDPAYTCGTPETPPTPVRGFGRVWCNNASVRNGVGNAVEGEYAMSIIAQQFESGQIMQTDDRTLVLFNDGSWVKR
jgi:serine/threonine protein kinase, bacterial